MEDLAAPSGEVTGLLPMTTLLNLIVGRNL